MTNRAGQPPPDPPDPRSLAHTLARDWITMWQSELAAIAADREVQETWRVMLAAWARAAIALVPASPQAAGAGARSDPPPAPDEPAAGSPRTDAAPRAAPAAAAFDARDAEIETLAQHVARLEARIAELERGFSRGSHPRRVGKRRP